MKPRRKNVITNIPIWLIWRSESLESQALIPNVMKQTHKIEEKRDQWLRNQPLQGGNLLYIT